MATLSEAQATQEFMSRVRDSIERSRVARRQHEIDWLMDICFYVGRQYAAYHTTKGIIDMPRVRPDQVRIVVNLIINYVRTQVASLMGLEARFEVVPQTPTADDIQSAKVAQRILSYIYDSGLESLMHEFYLWLVVTGNAFLFTTIDRDRGPEAAPGVREGEVAARVVSPFDVYLPTGIDDPEDAHWCAVRTAMPPQEVRAVYGVEAKPDTSSVSGGIDARLRAIAMNEMPPQDDLVTVIHYFERPSRANPDGCYAAIIGDRVASFVSPYPYDHGELPIAMARHTVVPGSLYGMSLVKQAIPLQKEYNRARSQMVEIRNLYARPTIVAPEGSIARTIEAEPGKVVFYRPIGAPPTVMPPPPINAAQVQDTQLIKTEMDTVFGLFDISAHGTVPANVRAASAMAMLREQDERRLGLTAREVERALSRVARQALGLVRQFYNRERVVAIVGENREYEALRFSARDVQIPRDIRVSLGSSLPTSRTQRVQMIYDLWELGIIQDRAKVLELLEFGDIEQLRDESTLDYDEAERENQSFTDGVFDLAPDLASSIFHAWQNHAVHYEVHNRLRKTPQYTKLGEAARQALDAHVSMHMRAIEAEMQAQAAMQAGGQAAAAE